MTTAVSPGTSPGANPGITPRFDAQGVASEALDGVFIDLSVSWWRGKEKLSANDLGLEPSDVPDIFRLGQKLVVPESALLRFSRLKARADFLINQFTFPFPTGHLRFVPYSVLGKVIAELDTLKDRFIGEIEGFLDKYDDYRQEIIDKYPKYADALGREYMPAHEFRKRCEFAYSFYAVQVPRGMKMRAMRESEAKSTADAKVKAALEAQDRFRADFQAQIDQFLDGAVGTLRAGIGNAVLGLAERLKKGDLVTEASLSTVRKAIERFRNLNFVGDGEVEAGLRKLEFELIKVQGQKMSENPDLRNELQKAIEYVTKTVADGDVSKVTGELKRKILM